MTEMVERVARAICAEARQPVDIGWRIYVGHARAVLSVPGIFIAPDRQPEDSDLGYRGRIAIAMQEWFMSLKTGAINEGDA